MSIELTPDQKNAFEKVKKTLSDPETPAITIKGSAGTGKTFLTKYIADYITDNTGKNICAIAPTHKAKRVLRKMLNQGRFLPVKAFTVASVLGKLPTHSYIGSRNYKGKSTQKMDNFNVLILDEVSMVSDTDLDTIIDYVCEYDKKLIIIGDDCQIPSPSQKLVKENGICYKPNSTAFDLENICELKTIVRQSKDSPIITLATYLRDNIEIANNVQDILTATGLDDDTFHRDYKGLYKEVVEDIKISNTRIIAYTNSSVRAHNKGVRLELKYDKRLVVGELLTGYTMMGYPIPFIENGTDYTVTSIRPTNKQIISCFTDLVGDIVDLEDVDEKTHREYGLFFINATHSSNSKFMLELVRMAEKVNRNYSTKNDYKNYKQLKDRAVFLEDVYKYNGVIMTENDFRQLHPLIFSKVSDVIDVNKRNKIKNEYTEKIEDKYSNIIEDRLSDNKSYSDSETLADRYMIVAKDIYYGYSITAHKSQGSTYDSVYVDEKDFKKISNTWNYRMQAWEDRCSERNQLRYVSYTRSRNKLCIVE